MKEIWNDVKGYEGLYQVSNKGNVKRIRFINIHTNRQQEREKSLKKRKDGYLEVALYKNGNGKSYQVHRLVAIAFVKNPDNKPYVNHIDGDKTNNNVDNLEWVTESENSIHSTRILKKNVRSVIQTDLEENYIATYPSATIASETTGINISCILNALAKRRSKAGQYKWKYVETED